MFEGCAYAWPRVAVMTPGLKPTKTQIRLGSSTSVRGERWAYLDGGAYLDVVRCFAVGVGTPRGKMTFLLSPLFSNSSCLRFAELFDSVVACFPVFEEGPAADFAYSNCFKTPLKVDGDSGVISLEEVSLVSLPAVRVFAAEARVRAILTARKWVTGNFGQKSS